MTNTNDTTGPADFARKPGQEARDNPEGYVRSKIPLRAPSGPEIPSRWPVGDDRTVAALTIRLADVEAERNALAKRLDDFAAEAVSEKVNASIALEDMTAQRDELARKVEALSVPRVFNVAGLVESDLAERYQSLSIAFDAQRAAGSEAIALVMEAEPSVRLVNDWATWSDASLYAFADAILAKYPPKPSRDSIADALHEIRHVARNRLGDNGFTIQPAYDDEARERAITAASGVRASGDEHGKTLRAWFGRIVVGRIVDAVAEALGMRRAGA